MTTTHDAKTGTTVSNGTAKPKGPPAPKGTPAPKAAAQEAPKAPPAAASPATAPAEDSASAEGEKKEYYNSQRKTLGPIGFVRLRAVRSAERMGDYIAELNRFVDTPDALTAASKLQNALDLIGEASKLMEGCPKDAKAKRAAAGTSEGGSTRDLTPFEPGAKVAIRKNAREDYAGIVAPEHMEALIVKAMRGPKWVLCTTPDGEVLNFRRGHLGAVAEAPAK